MTTENTIPETSGLSNDEIQKALAAALKKKQNAENRVKLTPEEREAKKKEEAAAREARKAERARKAEERKQAEANAPAAHMAKVLKARANLPELTDNAQDIYSEITSNLSVLEISALQLHLGQYVREQQTQAALEVKLEKGQMVRILRGSKNIGKLARVVKSARVRTYVQVIGATKEEYLFTSDVEAVQSESLSFEESELIAQNPAPVDEVTETDDSGSEETVAA